MKRLAVFLLAAVLACDDDNEFGLVTGGATAGNLDGLWFGVEEITTAEDPGLNTGSPADRGFVFPVLLDLRRNGRFELVTSGFQVSFDDESERSCRGVYVRQGHTISFFPEQACRALPLVKYSVGSVAPRGITLQANSRVPNNAAPYLTMRVFFRLDRD